MSKKKKRLSGVSGRISLAPAQKAAAAKTLGLLFWMQLAGLALNALQALAATLGATGFVLAMLAAGEIAALAGTVILLTRLAAAEPLLKNAGLVGGVHILAQAAQALLNYGGADAADALTARYPWYALAMQLLSLVTGAALVYCFYQGLAQLLAADKTLSLRWEQLWTAYLFSLVLALAGLALTGALAALALTAGSVLAAAVTVLELVYLRRSAAVLGGRA